MAKVDVEVIPKQRVYHLTLTEEEATIVRDATGDLSGNASYGIYSPLHNALLST